jgi:GTP pyrophosphokinase
MLKRLEYVIKGKSIYSIRRKMLNQNVSLMKSMINLPSHRLQSKSTMKKVSSLDIFHCNRLSCPSRLRWISSPKSTGYEALHMVMGPKGRWVEVQVRSERMDEIAERICSTLQI